MNPSFFSYFYGEGIILFSICCAASAFGKVTACIAAVVSLVWVILQCANATDFNDLEKIWCTGLIALGYYAGSWIAGRKNEK